MQDSLKQAEAPETAPRSAGLNDARISRWLIYFGYMAGICSSSGALIYCYESSLASVRRSLVLLHELSGDAAMVLLGVYLAAHLRRTWTLRGSRPLSWWTGIAGAAAWVVSGGIGVYGQFSALPRYEGLWWLHSAGGLLAIMVAGFHAAYGFRVRASTFGEAR